MTVKCLTEIQKEFIADLRTNGKYSISRLAREYQVSRRTIDRVLAEQELEDWLTSYQQQTKPAPENTTFWNSFTAFFGRLFN